MPQDLNYLKYTVIGKDGAPDERKILVINGVPFYFSTGTSVDREQIIGPAWRENLWMPFVGVDIKPGKEGHISKLGSHIKGQKATDFEAQLKEKLITVFKSMEKSEGDKILKSLLLERYRNMEEIDNNLIFGDLAQQLTRFGTVEMMIISMNISPQQWEKNVLLQKFMEQVIADYPQYKHYQTINLPSLIEGAKEAKIISANIDNVEQLKNASTQINEWLKIETNKKEQLSENISESRELVTTFLNNYDYTNPEAQEKIKDIEGKLCKKLTDELSAFRERRGANASMNNSDKIRNKVVKDLEKNFRKISNETIAGLTRDNQDSWKQTYQEKLTTAIKDSLNRKELEKYNFFEKLGRSLLNIVFAIGLPLAGIKKLATGTFFFSTVGKSKEAVEETKHIVESELINTSDLKERLNKTKYDSKGDEKEEKEKKGGPSLTK